MSDVLSLTGLRVRGFHGVLPEERREGQDFVVDVRLDVDVARAAATDDLADAVDYAALAERLAAVVAGDPVDLVETLVERLADVCLATPGVAAAEVTLHKPEAPVGLPFSDVSVTVRRAPVRGFVGLGSNLGDRLEHLRAGLRVLAEHGVRVGRVSGVYETAPVGGPDQGPYLNAVAEVRAPSARVLLAAARAAEAAAGRERGERWGPRTLDVDLLSVDGVERADPGLTLPHPRAAERAFVLVPWAEVDPGAAVGRRGTVGHLRDGLPADAVAGVRRCDELVLR